MSVVSRHSLAAAGLVCLAALCPETLPAQRGGPNADTPGLLERKEQNPNLAARR